jgi:hypothetical protein
VNNVFNNPAEFNKEPIMNATQNTLFFAGFNSYKKMSAAAAALVTGMILVWFSVVAQNAAHQASLSNDHRMVVTATRLVQSTAPIAAEKVAAVQSATTLR